MSTNQGHCPQCKQSNSYSNLTCELCGARLPWASTVMVGLYTPGSQHPEHLTGEAISDSAPRVNVFLASPAAAHSDLDPRFLWLLFDVVIAPWVLSLLLWLVFYWAG